MQSFLFEVKYYQSLEELDPDTKASFEKGISEALKDYTAPEVNELLDIYLGAKVEDADLKDKHKLHYDHILKAELYKNIFAEIKKQYIDLHKGQLSHRLQNHYFKSIFEKGMHDMDDKYTRQAASFGTNRFLRHFPDKEKQREVKFIRFLNHRFVVRMFDYAEAYKSHSILYII